MICTLAGTPGAAADLPCLPAWPWRRLCPPPESPGRGSGACPSRAPLPRPRGSCRHREDAPSVSPVSMSFSEKLLCYVRGCRISPRAVYFFSLKKCIADLMYIYVSRCNLWCVTYFDMSIRTLCSILYYTLHVYSLPPSLLAHLAVTL